MALGAIVVPFMYPRVKRVRRGAQLHEYVQLVEGHRVDGKVRQRVVATLGRLDELKATGQLDRWAGAFARLDPPPVGTRREVGPLLLVTHYLRRLGLTELVDAAAPMRGRSLLTHGEVISAPDAQPATSYSGAGQLSRLGVRRGGRRTARGAGWTAQRRPARSGVGGLRHRRRRRPRPSPAHHLGPLR